MILDCGGYFQCLCKRCHDIRLDADDKEIVFVTEREAEKYEEEFSQFCMFCSIMIDVLGSEPSNVNTEWWDYRLERRRER